MPCSRMPKWKLAAAQAAGQHGVGLRVLLVGERCAGHVLGALDRGRRGRREVGRAADELGDRPRPGPGCTRPSSARVACALAPVKSGSASSQPSGSRPDSTRSNSATTPGVGGRRARAFQAACAAAPRSRWSKCACDLVRHVEVLVGIPAVGLLRQADLVLAERRAVRLGRVLRVRRADRDVRAHDDQRRPRRLGVAPRRARRAGRSSSSRRQAAGTWKP